MTESAIKAIMLAAEETKRLGHVAVGTTQLLVGLMGTGKREILDLFKPYGYTGRSLMKAVRLAEKEIIGQGSDPQFVPHEPQFEPRVKRSLEHAWDIALECGHNYIAPSTCSLPCYK